MKKVRLFYEPKMVPVLDSDGNVMGYTHPIANPNSLDKIDDLRIKTAPNELGVSADPSNVTGFRRLVDIINQNRNNPSGSSIANVGYDDLSIMSKTTNLIKKVKKSKTK